MKATWMALLALALAAAGCVDDEPAGLVPTADPDPEGTETASEEPRLAIDRIEAAIMAALDEVPRGN